MIELGKCSCCSHPFEEGNKIIYCQQCSGIYHLECWEGNEACITSDCQGQPVAGYAASQPVEVGFVEKNDKEELALEKENHTTPEEAPEEEDENPVEVKVKAGATGEKRYKEPVLACLLNLLLLGAGYMYLGQVGKGFIWLFIGFVTALVTLGIGGFVVLAWVMYDSYRLAHKMNEGDA